MAIDVKENNFFAEHCSNAFGKRFAKALKNLCAPEILALATETIHRRKIIDFFLTPGCISGRVLSPVGELINVEVHVKLLTEHQWSELVDVVTQSAYLWGSLLSGGYPDLPTVDLATSEAQQVGDSVDGDLLEHGMSGRGTLDRSIFDRGTGTDALAINDLVKEDSANHLLALVPDSSDISLVAMHDGFLAVGSVSLLLNFWIRAMSNPFLLCYLRGKTKEEILDASLVRRYNCFMGLTASSQATESDVTSGASSGLPLCDIVEEKLTNYWNLKSDLSELKLEMRADELPGSLLNRISPLPLHGMEEEVEPLLKNAYDEVAKRSQLYGLIIKRRKLRQGN